MRRVYAIIAGRGLRSHPAVELVFLLVMLGFVGYLVWIIPRWPGKILITALVAGFAVPFARSLIRSWRSGEYRHRGGIE